MDQGDNREGFGHYNSKAKANTFEKDQGCLWLERFAIYPGPRKSSIKGRNQFYKYVLQLLNSIKSSQIMGRI